MVQERTAKLGRSGRVVCGLLLACGLHARARGQAPTLLESPPGGYGSVRSRLGTIPGAGANVFGTSPGTGPEFLGGRAGTSAPRVPTAITTPGGGVVAPARGVAAPPRLMITDVPLFGPLAVPAADEEEGPADGLSLDAAIERLVRNNTFLRAQALQIPAARADALTASLRANPILYADGQLVPYGRYNRDHPGGPTQYDLNVTHPIDYSLKRIARTAAAEVQVAMQESLYRNAVRLEINNLFTAFVDVLAARETVRYARASEEGLRNLVHINETLYAKADLTRADLNRSRATLDAAVLAVADGGTTLQRTRRTLATLLNAAPDQADEIQVRGRLADVSPPPPPVEELQRVALADRPDLFAARLGVRFAEAGVRVARASRFHDAYLLMQPYTFQDLSPTGQKSATSWAVGLTFPAPVYNRNQGGIARAVLNVEQSRIEAASVERRVAVEVVDAFRAYELSRELVRKIERDLLPAARQSRDDTLKLFIAGGHGITAVEFNQSQRDYNQAVRQYRDALIRHRRDMLALNTAVGRRVMP
jgi:cobalt-zinc-cadmium efflux system outer membrane protein